ncbi:hypothetical protein GCM10011613_21720 [Cellvibrio zantedeschiae]|uniref:Dipeptidylpeptidase IV N-terminal domain-containing protein n=1 Tax=Cellvibrio zantedeschiae TaxID=1237077 RepID=A0ABQ3B3R8_9GAMM|nr:hypothetical protein [Cellvibrio zantedeschiae]GGY76863.1 hypothetical protein GCM10011613_21720 [Cellvibrio zantedeschiae]
MKVKLLRKIAIFGDIKTRQFLFYAVSCLLLSTTAAAQTNSQSNLPGRIWHSWLDLNNPEGTYVLNLNSGVSARVDAKDWGAPWPDGARFVYRNYTSDGSVGDETNIVVKQASDGKILSEQTIEGYLGEPVPSPIGENKILAAWGATILEPRGMIVYDLNLHKPIFATQPGKMSDAVSWMPDGTLLRAKYSGEITRITLGGNEQPIGKISWPESRFPQAIYVSPDGKKVLVQLAAFRETGTISGVDLWMMNLDGSNLKRFTKNDLIARAYWSPDSKYVAFIKDTGTVCTEATCRGSCTVWYAEATAANVVAVAASEDAKRFTVTRPNGDVRNLGCPVVAWSR